MRPVALLAGSLFVLLALLCYELSFTDSDPSLPRFDTPENSALIHEASLRGLPNNEVNLTSTGNVLSGGLPTPGPSPSTLLPQLHIPVPGRKPFWEYTWKARHYGEGKGLRYPTFPPD
eukprot:RCo050062